MVDPPPHQARDTPGGTRTPTGTAPSATSDPRPPDIDRPHASTPRTPPSDQPVPAPQPPVPCASAQSARPGAWRQAAGRTKAAVTGTTGLGALGLIGAAQLTAASYLARGAHPRGVPTVTVWLLGTILLGAAWLGLGRRLDRLPTRRLLVIGLSWVATLAASAPLASRDGYAYACQGALVAHRVSPYTHGIAALPCQWLHAVPELWWRTPAPYGPLWLLLSGGAAAGSGGHLGVAIALLRVIALAGVALIAWAGHRLAVRLGVDPRRAAWLGVLSPLVLVHAVSGVHNDALLAGFVVAGFAVAIRPGSAGGIGPAAAGRAVPGRAVPGRALLGQAGAGQAAAGQVAAGRATAWWVAASRAVAAGALLGLAVGVKATVLVVLPFVVLLAAGDRRWWEIARTALATCLGLAAGYAVFAVPSGYGLGWLGALRGTTDLIQWTSLPTGLGMTAGYLARALGRPDLATPALAAARVAGLLVLAAILVALWLRARSRVAQPRSVVAAAGAAMVATVLLAPVAFPWYLLAPLAVLAYSVSTDRVRYRLGLAAAVLALFVLPDGSGLAALTKLPGALLDTVVIVTVLVVVLRHRAGRATPTATEW
ncbi:polyprenol phosphomannose-dependent alpha 1,6 mannosyltransferase MptB [Rugosimonospora africana]|uniref:Alpha-1,6-mannosyltransferase n=1 Tax=Rugosimonospora africana TaxID=556532 RepID=A0A8J3VUI0_9ACTN|nr:polyprenol phosphomannose-dependent alpha 1,6 mannosyltransferase MptB [Rugosimonospora africana]GIH18673.1 hypothetical protein Raf01_68450 [Rugosimonospora africana]